MGSTKYPVVYQGYAFTRFGPLNFARCCRIMEPLLLLLRSTSPLLPPVHSYVFSLQLNLFILHADHPPAKIYADQEPTFSYYLRMDKNPEDMTKNHPSFLRHCGPPILPSCEVVYVVHPTTIALICGRDTPPEGIDQRAWDRIHKALGGEDVSILRQMQVLCLSI